MTAKPAHGRPDNLYEPVAEDGGERGRNWTGRTRARSIYTDALLRPYATAAVFSALAFGAAIISRGRLLSSVKCAESRFRGGLWRALADKCLSERTVQAGVNGPLPSA
jgi:hypothetical protein